MHKAEAQLTAGRQGRQAASRDTPRGGPMLPLGGSHGGREKACEAFPNTGKEERRGERESANLGGTQHDGGVRRILTPEMDKRQPDLKTKELGSHTDSCKAMADAKGAERGDVGSLPFEG